MKMGIIGTPFANCPPPATWKESERQLLLVRVTKMQVFPRDEIQSRREFLVLVIVRLWDHIFNIQD
jgi:hypothetical protein